MSFLRKNDEKSVYRATFLFLHEMNEQLFKNSLYKRRRKILMEEYIFQYIYKHYNSHFTCESWKNGTWLY